MSTELLTYWVAYLIALTIMGAVAYRYREHTNEPETFIGMVVPVVIPLIQQAFSIDTEETGNGNRPLEPALLLMVVALSSSYFLGNVIAWAVDDKERFWPYYLSFLLWGTSGALTAGLQLRESEEDVLLHAAIVLAFGVLLPMIAVAYISTSPSLAISGDKPSSQTTPRSSPEEQRELRKRVIVFVSVCCTVFGAAMLSNAYQVFYRLFALLFGEPPATG